MKVFCKAFLELQLGFVIFWRKNMCTQSARKILMKLTTGITVSRSIPERPAPGFIKHKGFDSKQLLPRQVGQCYKPF